MYLLSMKNINLVFSILFISWCILHLKVSNKEKSNIHERLGYNFEEKELATFWILVIFLTSFNIFAFFTKQFLFYLFGAVGMIGLCCAQIIFVLVSFRVKMSEAPEKQEKFQFENRFGFLLVTFPYLFFGIQSSLFCYHQRLNQTGQNQNKFHRFFLQFCVIDNQKINLFFNISISIAMFLLFILMIKDNSKFHGGELLILAPFIPTTFCIFAFCFKEKKFYRGTIISWAIMGLFFIYIFVASIKNTPQNRMHDLLLVTFICIINAIVGCFSVLSIYFQTERKVGESSFENQNYVSYSVAEDNVNL